MAANDCPKIDVTDPATLLVAADWFEDCGDMDMATRHRLAADVDRIGSRRTWEVCLVATNYFGHVPADWEEVVESLSLPTTSQIQRAIINPDNDLGDDLDAYIAAAVELPDGYEGVGVEVREKR